MNCNYVGLENRYMKCSFRHAMPSYDTLIQYFYENSFPLGSNHFCPVLSLKKQIQTLCWEAHLWVHMLAGNFPLPPP